MSDKDNTDSLNNEITGTLITASCYQFGAQMTASAFPMERGEEEGIMEAPYSQNDSLEL